MPSTTNSGGLRRVGIALEAARRVDDIVIGWVLSGLMWCKERKGVWGELALCKLHDC